MQTHDDERMVTDLLVRALGPWVRQVDKLTLRNFEGRLGEYVEPRERDCSCPYEEVYFQSPAASATGTLTSRGNPGGAPPARPDRDATSA